jgi:hypothetical protein
MDQEFFTVKPVATIKYPMKSLNVRYYLSAAVHKFGNVFLRPIYQSRSLGPNGVPKPELGNERSQEPPLHPLAGERAGVRGVVIIVTIFIKSCTCYSKQIDVAPPPGGVLTAGWRFYL